MIRRWLEARLEDLRMLGQLVFLLLVFCMFGSIMAMPLSILVFLASLEGLFNALTPSRA